MISGLSVNILSPTNQAIERNVSINQLEFWNCSSVKLDGQADFTEGEIST